MDRSPFVGREAELTRLRAILAGGVAGKGSVALIQGAPGIGKTQLISELIETAPTTPGLAQAVFARGRCYEETGAQSAYQPFGEIFQALYRGESRGHRLIADFPRLLKEMGPDWLALATGLPGVAIAAKTAVAATDAMLQGRASRRRTDDVMTQYIAVIDRLVRQKQLIVLVIEDAHWIDRSSAALLVQLAERMSAWRLVVILSCRAGERNPDDPLGYAYTELAARKMLDVIDVTGLSQPQIDDYLETRFGAAFGSEFSEWLIHLCQGNPLFLSQYLDVLEQEGIIERVDGVFRLDGSVHRTDGSWVVRGRLAELPTSGNLDALLDWRVRSLLHDERELLQVGAVQGPQFDSLVLSKVSDLKELAVLAQLREVSDRHRIITRRSGDDWQRDRAETYAFEHMLMQLSFYRKLSPRERLLLHAEVARVLSDVASSLEAPPRKLLIDVAYHCKNGGRYQEAAETYMRAARLTHADGAVFEAGRLAFEAVGCLRQVPVGTSRDEQLADAVLLRLICAEHGAVNDATPEELQVLAREGELAAESAGRTSLLAEILSIKGHLRTQAGSVKEGIAVMRQARELARATGDPVTEFFTATQLGSQLAKENLNESYAVRYQALQIFDEQVSKADLPPDQRDLMLGQRATLITQIGLAEFDTGNFEKALDRINEGLGELKSHHKIDEIPAALNYLAQVHTAIGQFEIAEQFLRDSIGQQDGTGTEVGPAWVGYNLGLLGKVLLDAERVDEAVATMAKALRISEAANQTDLLTIVWNYAAEVFMSAGNPQMDLDAAERVLRRNLEVSGQNELQRAATQAASLLGQALLRRSLRTEALAFSAEAVAKIDEMGDMPAVRTEEILYHHSLVLDALGRMDEGTAFLVRAWDAFRSKLDRLELPEHRTAFTDRVPLNVAIAAAYERRVAAVRTTS